MRVSMCSYFLFILLNLSQFTFGQEISWQEVQKLKAPDASLYDNIGETICISGRYLVAGSSFADDGQGLIYVYDKATGGLLHRFDNSTGSNQDSFGQSVAISGDKIFIGAPNKGAFGAVLVYDLISGESLGELLASSSIDDGARFGESLSVSSTHLAVGIPSDGSNNQGSIIVFDLSNLQEISKVYSASQSFDQYFGSSISLSDSYLLVGIPNNGFNNVGKAQLYNPISGNLVGDLTHPALNHNDWFGQAVTLNDTYAAVSAPGDSTSGDYSGTVYVFDLLTQEFLYQLFADDAKMYTNFGSNLKSSGEILIADGTDSDDSWRGYVYGFDLSSGQQVFKINSSETGDGFAYRFDIEGKDILVGASRDNDLAMDSGASYHFELLIADSAPTDISLSNDSVMEGQAFGTLVGVLSAEDRNIGESFIYELISGQGDTDNSSFLISGVDSDELQTMDVFNFDIQSSYSVRVRVTDSTGNTFEKILDISVIKDPDSDGDGFSDDAEIALGTDPNSYTSFPDFTDIGGVQPAELEVGFSFFGSAISLAGNTGIVGAPGENNDTRDSGSAYLYDLSTGDSTLELRASDAGYDDFYGSSVGISQSYAIVGAPYKDLNSNTRDIGAAYIYNLTTGQEIFKETGVAAYEEFGKAVAISETYAVVGAWRNSENGYESGKAYAYDLSNGYIRFLSPTIPSVYDGFGSAVAIKENIAVIGAPGNDRAFIFDLATGTQLFKLLPDSASQGYFGSAISIYGNIVAVGAPFEDDQGAVYLFDLQTGEQLKKLTSENTEMYNELGWSVAINEHFVVAGAPGDSVNEVYAGAAFVFDVKTGKEVAKLSVEYGQERDYFGTSVAISGDSIYVGKKGDEYASFQSGSVHIFKIGIDGSFIDFQPSSGGTLSGDLSQKIPVGGQTSEVTAVADPGYYFAKWFVLSGTYDGAANSSLLTDNPIIINNVNNDLELMAEFYEDKDYTVNYSADPNGSVDISSEIIRNGQSSSAVTATADPGYAFISWGGDISSKQNPLVIDSVTSDLNIFATFDKVFTTKWDTTIVNASSTNENQIKLPLMSTGQYSFVVDWGDGEEDFITQYDQYETKHTYDSPGVYTVKIRGLLKGWSSTGNNDRYKLQEISMWGALQFINGSNFKYCSNLFISATDLPNFSSCTDLTSLFESCRSITTIPNIDDWDVSGITNMSRMFMSAINFNGHVSQWDVSNVTNMSNMFYLAEHFNCDLTDWDVSSAVNLNGMFSFAYVFNGDVSQWDVSNVTDFGGIFKEAHVFNGDISNWDVSSGINMSVMFGNAFIFNGDISNWDVSSAHTMYGIFSNAWSFNSDISNWDVSNVTNMNTMFYYATSFNQDISAWNVSNAISMDRMFYQATSFDQDLSNWDVSSVQIMDDIFLGVTLPTNVYDNLLNNWEAIAQAGVSFHGGNSKFTSASEAARTRLINEHGWSITDGGKLFIVSFSSDSNGSVNSTGNHLIASGYSSPQVTATPNTGYYFNNWSVESGAYNGSANTNLATDNPLIVNSITDDLSLKAEFSPYQYSVEFTTSTKGTLSGKSSQMVNYNESTSPVTAVPNEGYVFKQWTGDINSSDNPLTISGVTGPVSVSAEYELDDSLRMEFGEASVTSDWISVSYLKEFKDPVVIIGAPSRNEADFVTVRIRNAGVTGFEVRLQEWEYLDGVHASENIYYIVVERGSYTLPSGQKLVAGSIEASGGSFANHSFPSALSSTPALLSSVATFNDEAAVTRRVKNVSASGFELRLQEADADINKQTTIQDHATETVNYIAIERGVIPFEGKDLHVDTISPVDERVKDVGIYGYEYFIASDQTYAGSDNGTIRMQGDPESGPQLIFEEEQSKDDELAHANETVAYVAVFDQLDITIEEPTMEIANISVSTEWHTINITESFVDPIIIAGPLSNNETEAVTVKIRNVSPTSFDIKLQEFALPLSQDKAHVNESLTYMIVDRGVYILPSGKILVADSTDLSNSTRKTVSYGTGMSSVPKVLSSVVTDNDEAAVVTRIRNVNASGFQMKLREAEKNNQSHAAETVHYIAIESGTITTSGFELFVSSKDSVNNNLTSIDPLDYTMFIAGQQTENGGDTAWVRRSGDINIFIEEEQSKDTELNHTNEAVAYILIKPAAAALALEAGSFEEGASLEESEEESSEEEGISAESNLYEVSTTPLSEGESLSSIRIDDEFILPTTSDYAEVTLRDGSMLFVYVEDGIGETVALSGDAIRMFYEVKTENWLLDFKNDLNLLGFDVVSANIVNNTEITFVDYDLNP